MDPRRAETKATEKFTRDWDTDPEQHTDFMRMDMPPSAGKAQTQAMTAPQQKMQVSKLLEMMKSGEVAPGNVELAAIMGYAPAQKALGRKASKGLTVPDLIKFILTDPNLKVSINVGQ